MAKKGQEREEAVTELRELAGGGERVTLVGFHDGKVECEYSIPNGNVRESISFPKCADKPGDDFADAFEALTDHALSIIGLNDTPSWEETARVTKLHISYDPKSGRRGYVLTMYQPLEHGGVVLNTPVRQERLEPTEIGAGFASDELRNTASTVCAEALAYVRGQREQGELFKRAG